MRSPFVIISWWSNCLGLTCLQHLTEHTSNRDIYVVQVGKSHRQRQSFRNHIPKGVTELPYPVDAPAEHSRVLGDIALRQLKSVPGVWFIDHDVFMHEACEPWLKMADGWLNQTDYCLCLPTPLDGPAITQPAFWLSPARWPVEITSFDPIPFKTGEAARRPDLFCHNGDLKMPLKDTLVQARDDLQIRGRVGYFPLKTAPGVTHALPSFPAHTHLGGLSLFTGPILPPAFNGWMKTTVASFTDFFETCPDDWIAIEDPELLRRFLEFQAVSTQRVKI